MAAASVDASTGKDEETFVLPRAPLPEIIVSNVPGSWAYDTMVNQASCVILLRAYDSHQGRALRILKCVHGVGLTPSVASDFH